MELPQELRDRLKIQDWAWNRCDVDDTPMKKLVCEVKKRGYLTKCELIKVAKWKVPKKRNTLCNVRKNCLNDVKEMTRAAFRTTIDDSIYYLYNQRAPRDVGLYGVRIPMGSAILHWFHEGRYPIWDRYAIQSVQLDKSQYRNKFERWKVYTLFCRDIADEYEVCMRTLDRALFQYGKNNNSRSC